MPCVLCVLRGPAESACLCSGAVIEQRASTMFSGNTGAVVAAGEGLATSAPSYGLARDVMAVVDGRAHVWAAVATAFGRCHAVGVAESGH